jgi:hypothetical protein
VTSQPYAPQSASRTEPSAGSSVASEAESKYDPDLIVLDDDDVEEVDVEDVTGADEFVSADEGDLGDETDEAEPAVAATTGAATTGAATTGAATTGAATTGAATTGAATTGAATTGGITPPEDPSPTELAPTELTPTEPVLSEQWHDIQAMFVDDPQGSVQRAAAAADDAVSALVESLRQRQAVLGPADPADTEQLRSTLRSYRIFCQRVAALDEQLPRVIAMDR